MTSSTVLISDATYKHSIALARYLKAYNPSLKLVGCSTYKPKFEELYFKFYDEWNVGDLTDQLENIPHLLAIPVSGDAVRQFLLYKETHAVLPPVKSFEVAMSKEETTRLAKKLGVPVPKTFYPLTMDQLQEIKIPFPWVVKGIFEAGKNIVHYANNVEQARKAFFNTQNDLSQHDQPPLIQEYIKGSGVGFFAFYQNGVLKRYYIHRRIREIPYTGGSSTAAQTIDHPKALEYGKKLLDALQWNGPAMVEFKECKRSGELRLLEINPKLWGSLELGLAAGVNFGELLVRTINGEDLEYSDKYDKIKFYWPFEGDILSILRSGRIYKYFEYLEDDYLSDVRTNGLKLNLLNFFRYMK